MAPIACSQLPPALLTRKIGALLELFGLSHAANQDIGSSSKGMKQKVMIIAALLHDPDVLVLDEPDSGLDVTATLVLRPLVIALARRGKAVLDSSRPRVLSSAPVSRRFTSASALWCRRS